MSELEKNIEKLKVTFNEKLLETIKISKIDTSIKNQVIIIRLGSENLKATSGDITSFLELLRTSGIVDEAFQSNLIVTSYDFSVETLDHKILQEIVAEKLGLTSSRLAKVDGP